MTDQPKKAFGGKQERAGRPRLPRKTQQVSIGLDPDLHDWLLSLSREERKKVLDAARCAIRAAEIDRRIL